MACFAHDGAFPDTQWSLVRKAGDSTDTAALAALCKAYWYPVYSFVRSQGCGQEDAHDVTQGFFAALLERNDVASVDAARGRFRSWMRTAAKRHLWNEIDRTRAKKRGGARIHVSIDLVEAEERLQLEQRDLPTAEHLFDRCWARTLTHRALARLRAEYCDGEDHVLVEQLLADDDERPDDAETAAKLAISPQALRTRRTRMKERLRTSYGKYLRMEIAETVDGPAAVDHELRELLDVLF